MKRLFQLSIVAVLGLMAISCGTTQTASEALAENEFKNDVYKEIANNQNKFMEFMEVVHNSQNGDLWLMKDHMKMMENGKAMEIMEANPEMHEKMKNMMHDKLENDPAMRMQMMNQMKAKMMADPSMHDAMMQQMHAQMMAHPEMADEMMDKMIQFLHENPAMMEKMKAKMKAHQAEMEKQQKTGNKKQ